MKNFYECFLINCVLFLALIIGAEICGKADEMPVSLVLIAVPMASLFLAAPELPRVKQFSRMVTENQRIFLKLCCEKCRLPK